MLHTALLSALFAGAIAVLATVAIERMGGRLGGLIGSLPTTIVPASVGFWAGSSTAAEFQSALYAVPAGMLVNAVFLFSWRALPPRLPTWSVGSRLAAMVGLSLSIWGLLASALVLLMRRQPFSLLSSGIFFFLLVLSFGIWACRGNPPAPKGKRPVGALVLVLRGVLAAGAIGLSVAIAGMGIPLLAGMSSVFPAIFLTTMVSVWLSQGEAVQAGAVGPLMLGSSSVAAYTLLAPFLMLWLGPCSGAVLAWVLSVVLVSLPAWWWLRRQ
jgi:hypothetical protein